jgi:hypothetical protein
LEKQIGAGPVDRQIANLIDDQEAGNRVQLQLVVQPILRERPGERRDHGGRRGEQHAIALFDRFEPQPNRQMAFADAGRPEQHDVLAVLDEVAGRDLLQVLLIQRGLVGKVEGLQALHEREAGETGAHRDVLFGLGGHFFAQHLVEEVGVGEVLGRRLLQERIEPLAALQEPQPRQLFTEPFQLCRVHRGTSCAVALPHTAS